MNRATTTDPFPTAPVTRLMEPWRTSPSANTYGRLVSNANVARFSGHARPGQFAVGQDEPALVQPFRCARRWRRMAWPGSPRLMGERRNNG